MDDTLEHIFNSSDATPFLQAIGIVLPTAPCEIDEEPWTIYDLHENKSRINLVRYLNNQLRDSQYALFI